VVVLSVRSVLVAGGRGRGRVWRLVVLAVAVVGLWGSAAAGSGEDSACTVVGTDGDDVLVGGPGDDVICAYGGDDVIFGGAGNDVIRGGAGKDLIWGGGGEDRILGGDGEDWVGGGSGEDVLVGGGGEDRLFGGTGDDVLLGGAGSDLAFGGWGTDRCAAEREVRCEADPTDPVGVSLSYPADESTVFHVETVTATVEPADADGWVELLVDGVRVGSGVIVGGAVSIEWDTRTVGDGPHTVTVEVVDGVGRVAASDAVSVNVGNDTVGSLDRIMEDYASGLITADEYVTLGLQALCCAESLPGRYASEIQTLFGVPAGPDAPVDATQVALMFLSEWDALSPEVQQGIGSIGEIVYDPTAPAASARGALRAAPQGGGAYAEECFVDDPWRIHVGFPLPGAAEAFQCRVVSEHFEVYYNRVEGVFRDGEARYPMEAVEHLADVDPANGVPDYVDVIVTEMETSWDEFTAAGYVAPQGRRRVVINDLLGPGWTDGYTLPWLVQYERGIDWQGSGVPSQYLPRHEAFHVFQWEYISIGDAVIPATRIRWLMEATAEWAAHYVDERHPAADGSGSQYARRLPLFLAEPERLTESGAFGWVPWRAYGAFLFFEYLEERFAAGSDMVRQIWDVTGDGIIPTAATEAIEETISANGDTLAEVLTGFALANYRIEETYTDPARADWSQRLEDAGMNRRPAVAGTYPLSTDIVETFGDTHLLDDGGAVYVEFKADGATTGTLTVTVPEGTPAARALRLVDHPSLCPDGAGDVLALTPGTPLDVPVTPDCPRVTVMVAYPDLPFGTTRVSWEARWDPTPPVSTNLVNGGFETGDLTGWTVVDPGGSGGNVSVVGSPTHNGSFAARVTPFSAQPFGLEQPVDVDPWNTASVWVALEAGSQTSAQVTLELVGYDGVVVASTTRTLTTAGVWERLDVFYPLGSGTVRYRVVVTDSAGAVVLVDDGFVGIDL